MNLSMEMKVLSIGSYLLTPTISKVKVVPHRKSVEFALTMMKRKVGRTVRKKMKKGKKEKLLVSL